MVERFDLNEGGFLGERGHMEADPTGDYVRFSDYEALQKELAERTAERDRFLHDCAEYDRALDDAGEKVEAAESRADTLARRVEGLEAALRDQFCPRPCNGRPDKFDVGDCVDAGECGCSARAALTGERP